MEIRTLDRVEDVHAVEKLQREVWPGSEADVVPGHLLLTIEHNGGLLLGAFVDDSLVGFVLGFLGVDTASPERVAMARLKHCSHMLGVHPDYRDQGIGLALKLAQRRQLLAQGVRLATWTYDPLQSRNAHLNVRRLGALCRHYIPNAYGEMRDELNQGLPSDRFEVEWWVTSSRVETRVEGTRPPLDLANFLAAGAEKVNPASLDEKDLPHPSQTPASLDGNLLLVEIPPDIDRVKREDIDLAHAWRQHTRELFQSAFEAGYIVTDFVHLAGEQVPRSYYLLSHGEGTLG